MVAVVPLAGFFGRTRARRTPSPGKFRAGTRYNARRRGRGSVHAAPFRPRKRIRSIDQTCVAHAGPNTAWSHASQGRAGTASPPDRKPKRRKSGAENRPHGKKPQIPSSGVENGRRGTEPENPGNGGQNAPPDVKSPEIRKAEIAMAKTGRAAKTPQIPERREENRPRPKKRQIPENGGQNTPPDVKSPEIRNAEKALTKTGRDAKRPQIPERREENGPRGKKRQISQNGGQNTNPAPALLSAHARK